MKVYLEVTHTHEHKLKTGVQRVVRNLGEELANSAKASGVVFNLVISDPARRENAIILDLQEFLTGDPSYSPPLPIEVLPDVAFRSQRYLALRKVWRILRKFDFLNILDSPLFKKISERIIGGIFLSEIDKANQVEDDSSKFEPGDVLIVADAFWAPPYTALSLVGKAKAQGAKIIFLINDIFPVSLPEYVHPVNVSSFNHLFPRVLELADAFLYPSLDTKLALERHFFSAGIDKPNEKIFYGAEKTELSWIFENSKRVAKSVLMVGTVEPRKNHRLVLKWFLSMADKDTRLTVIGKIGWLSEALSFALDLASRKNKKFTWIQDASDEQLALELLRHEVGIMASHAEGLGLPILEYSRNGLKLVLSDIPIFREVAGDSAFYFDRGSVESLDKAINSAFASSQVSYLPEVTWRDTADEVMAFIHKNFK